MGECWAQRKHAMNANPIRQHAPRRLFLLAVVALAYCAAPASAQTSPSDDTPFSDSFTETALDATRWAFARAVTPLPGAEPPAVRLAAGRRGDDAAAQLRSRDIPLDAVRHACLSFELWSESDSDRPSLHVEYFATDGRWRPLARLRAWDVGIAGRPLPCSWVLPADALHEHFAFRIRAGVRGATAWYVSNVRVSADPRNLTVRVRSAPASGVTIPAALGDETRLEAPATPFEIARDIDESVTLVAPPAALGGVFSHWRVDELLEPDRERWITITPDQDVTLEAHYGPRDADQRALTEIFVDTDPPDLVDLRLANAPDVLAALTVRGGPVELFAGESLTCRAPRRVEGWVFERWWLDHESRDEAFNEITVTAGRHRELIAEYALVGDMNGDGRVSRDDIDVFIRAVADPQGYQRDYPELDRVPRGDLNGDGWLDGDDVEPFVRLFFDE